MKSIFAPGVSVTVFAALASASAYAQPAVQPAAGPPPVKALTMLGTAAPISDEKKAVDFYTKGLGLTPAGSNANEVFFTFPGGGSSLIMMKTKAGTALPVRNSLNRMILSVPNLKALEARLNAAGYKLRGPIRENAQYRVSVAFVDDPDGNVIELVQRGN